MCGPPREARGPVGGVELNPESAARDAGPRGAPRGEGGLSGAAA